MATLFRRGKIWWIDAGVAGQRLRWSLDTTDERIAYGPIIQPTAKRLSRVASCDSKRRISAAPPSSLRNEAVLAGPETLRTEPILTHAARR